MPKKKTAPKPKTDQPQETIRKVDIDSEIQQSYLDYAMSVIVARALPDARDGMKPVQRRILFAMHELNLSPTSAFKKSARIVGEVLGKYHPHGDMAVYESMARMAQDFSMRYRLVDGQGNFGSVDGDPPAAMRYTEARLAAPSAELLADLEKETVDFLPNFDGSLEEPEVLPAAVPNLLVNGATGIAVGMATSIPPHNLGEICDALVYMLRTWSRMDEVSVEELMKHIKGPDFPTGGLVLDPAGSEEGLLAAYGTGRGKITVRARAHIEETTRGRSRILVTELPYQVNKASLLERIADLVRDGTIPGISDLRDESDRRGMRIVIELARNADGPQVLRDLFKRTPMENTFSIILLALVKGEPRMLSLKHALRVFLDHRLDVIRKRSVYDLTCAKERAHILEGLRVALRNLEEVIRIIRAAKDSEEAGEKLQKRFKLTEIQATAILDMPLRRLASLEREKIELEYKEKLALIQQLEKLIASPKMQREVLTEDLHRVKKLYADPRRSVIVRAWERTEQAPVTVEETEPETQVWVSLLQNGEMAAIPGAKPPATFGNNPPKFILCAGSRDILYLFTEKGRAASVPVHAIPNREAPEEGVPFSSVCALEPRSRIIAGLVLAPVEDKDDARSVLMGTRKGMVKKTSVAELPGMSSQVFQAMKVAEDDSVGWVKVLSGTDNVLMVTASGMSIRYSEEEVRPTGWATVGVMGMKIAAHDDEVVGVTTVRPREEVLLMAASGQAKRVAWDKFPVQGRYGVGTAAWKTGAKLRLCGAEPGKGADRVILVHAGGASKTLNWQDAPLRNRASGGKNVIKLKPGDRILRILTLGGAGPVKKVVSRKQASAGKKSSAKKKNRPAKRKKK